MCPGYETSRSIVAGTLPLKENQMFTASDVIVCLKSKGVFFPFKKISLRLKSEALYQGFFSFDMEIPTFRNYVFDLDPFTAY